MGWYIGLLFWCFGYLSCFGMEFIIHVARRNLLLIIAAYVLNFAV